MPACSCCGWLFVEFMLSQKLNTARRANGVRIVQGAADGFVRGMKMEKVGSEGRPIVVPGSWTSYYLPYLAKHQQPALWAQLRSTFAELLIGGSREVVAANEHGSCRNLRR